MEARVFNLVLFLGLALLIGLELRSPQFRAGSFQKNARAVRNWSFLGAAAGSAWAMRLVTAELGRRVPGLLTWDRFTVANAATCFLAAELIGYLLHWIKHKNAWLWRFHLPHHRDSVFDIWLVSHTHALEVVVSGTLMSAVLILLGFSPLSLNVYFLFYALANTYQHSAFDYSLGWLDRIIIAPSYHRLHHAVGSDTNFGNTLTLWDIVFSTATWPASRRAPDVPIGLPAGPEPYGFAAEMSYFLRPPRS